MAETPPAPPARPALAPIERVLSGGPDQLHDHLRSLDPGLNIFFYDYGLVTPRQGHPIHTRTVDGINVQFNYPPVDQGDALEQRQVQLAEDVAARFPHLLQDPAANKEGLRLLFSKRGLTYSSEEALQLQEAGNGSLIEGAADYFVPTGRSQEDRANHIYILGLNSAGCPHCSATMPSLRAEDCETTSPAQARKEQLGRLFTGYHEWAHLYDKRHGLLEQMAEGYRSGPLATDPARESLADSAATLLLAKNLGAEGLLFAENFSTLRSHPLMGDTHFTTPALRATIAWAHEHSAELAGMDGPALMEKATELTSAHLQSMREYRTQSDFHGRWLLGDGDFSSVPELILRSRELISPESIRASARDLRDAQLPREFSYSQAFTPGPEQRYLENVNWSWDPERRQSVQKALDAFNPLATPDWAAREEARVQECKTALEPQLDQAARQHLAQQHKTMEALREQLDASGPPADLSRSFSSGRSGPKP